METDIVVLINRKTNLLTA